MAQEELMETQRQLDKAKGKLAEVEEGIASLQAKYNECISKKEDLEFKTNQCTARLERAEKVRIHCKRICNFHCNIKIPSGDIELCFGLSVLGFRCTIYNTNCKVEKH